jgi:hypothetical protein
VTFEEWWSVNDCCGLDREDVETIWMAGYRAAVAHMREATSGVNFNTAVAFADASSAEVNQ